MRAHAALARVRGRVLRGDGGFMRGMPPRHSSPRQEGARPRNGPDRARLGLVPGATASRRRHSRWMQGAGPLELSHFAGSTDLPECAGRAGPPSPWRRQVKAVSPRPAGSCPCLPLGALPPFGIFRGPRLHRLPPWPHGREPGSHRSAPTTRSRPRPSFGSGAKSSPPSSWRKGIV